MPEVQGYNIKALARQAVGVEDSRGMAVMVVQNYY